MTILNLDVGEKKKQAAHWIRKYNTKCLWLTVYCNESAVEKYIKIDILPQYTHTHIFTFCQKRADISFQKKSHHYNNIHYNSIVFLVSCIFFLLSSHSFNVVHIAMKMHHQFIMRIVQRKTYSSPPFVTEKLHFTPLSATSFTEICAM